VAFGVAPDENPPIIRVWQASDNGSCKKLCHSNERRAMPALMKFFHLLAAMAWLGGIAFMLLALRPAAAEFLTPQQRLPLIARVMQHFFALVWASIGVLLTTGLVMLLGVGMKQAPVGWHLMLGLGLLMFAIFGHLYFGPFRRLQRAVGASDWPEAGRRTKQIATLAWVNLGLGALAIGAVFFMV
jgi:uncharacterized membrane protein